MSAFRLHVVRDPNEAAAVAGRLRTEPVLGLDTESDHAMSVNGGADGQPTHPADPRMLPSLVQVATDTDAWVFDMTLVEPLRPQIDHDHRARMVRALEELLWDPRPRFVLHNAAFDLHVLANAARRYLDKDVTPTGVLCDTLTAEHLLRSDDWTLAGDRADRSLKGLCSARFNETLPDYADLFTCQTKGKGGGKKYVMGAWEILRTFGGADALIPYAAKDPWLTVRLYRALRAELDAAEWTRRAGGTLWDLYCDTERDLLHALVAAEREGAPIDVPRIRALGAKAGAQEARAAARWADEIQKLGIDRKLGRTPSIASNVDLCRVFGALDLVAPDYKLDPKRIEDPDFDRILADHIEVFGEDVPTVKSAGVVDAETLKHWGHPLADVVLSHREASKTRGTYCAPIDRMVALMGDGRLRASFRQAATRTNRLAARSPNCFHPDTELLTPAGWVRIDSLPRDVDVAAWRPDGSVAWERPTAYFQRPYRGDLVRFGGRVAALVTPDHRMVVSTMRGRWVDRAAVDFSTAKVVPTGGTLVGGAPLDEAQIRFVAAIQADGSIRPRRRAESPWVLRFGFKKDRKITRLRALSAAAGVLLTERTEATGVRTFYGSLPPWAWTYLDEHKLFRAPALVALSLDARLAFLDELEHWDGNRHSKGCLVQYWTAVRANAEAVLTIAAVSGVKASLGEYGVGRFAVSLMRSAPEYAIQPSNVRREPYTGDVYCLSVPSTYVLTRLRGRIVVTGQCQNISAKGLGAELRECFYAPEGYEVGAIDQAAIEARLAAVVSRDPVLLQVFRDDLDPHSRTAQLLFSECRGVPLDQIGAQYPKLRKMGKIINYLSLFGGGPKKLAWFAGIPFDAAKRAVREYWAAYATLARYKERLTERASAEGVVYTIMRRPIQLTGVFSQDPAIRSRAERQALNSVIQGSSADIIKTAMILIHQDADLRRDGVRLVLTVHDELVFWAPSGALQKHKARIDAYVSRPLELRYGYAMPIPTPATLDIGRTWGEAKSPPKPVPEAKAA
jgi:DNA polymerase I-like protein with 3'-5' exonuclease and polymerase domains